MEPVIDFIDKTEDVKPEPSIPKKPILVYKPTDFNPARPVNDPNSINIQIKKKWFKYLLLVIIIFGIGFAGFLIGKFL